MATYNGSAYLREELDPILTQSYANWHLTVSDDISTDETVRIHGFSIRAALILLG